jgi:nitrogen fixation/metabolism regulation signal transduction histidine kinase
MLANPIVIRMAIVFLSGAFAFAVGAVLVRRLRRSLLAEAGIASGPASLDSLPLHTYHAVIQQLKQQKHELESSQQAERRRAKTSENISAAVLANLSSGVMFITPNGLVRQANIAARQILGFAAPVGMGLKEIFRESEVAGSPALSLAEAIRLGLKQNTPFKQLEVEYVTPSGSPRVLEVTISGVQSPMGEPLGVSCLISDQTELANMRRQQALRGEMSAELALALRRSLRTISDCAQQLAEGEKKESVQRLASDIAWEATHLNRTIGGYLDPAETVRVTAGV